MPTSTFYKRHLPHWQVEGATYFVTYVVQGALPNSVAEIFRDAKVAADRNQAVAYSNEENYRRTYSLAFSRMEKYLESGAGSDTHLLVSPSAKQIIIESLKWIEESGDWRVLVVCVMSNHVHVVVCQVATALEGLLKRHKSFVANQINKSLGRTGKLWHAESFDHMPRTTALILEKCRYTLLNPVKAGLVASIDEYDGMWYDASLLKVKGNSVSWQPEAALPLGLYELRSERS